MWVLPPLGKVLRARLQALHAPSTPLFTQPHRETVWKVSDTGQPPRHQPYHRGVDERFRACAQPLVTLARPPVLREPGERALYHPPSRQHPKASGRHQSLPVDRLSLFGPLLCPRQRDLLGDRLRRLAYDLHTQVQDLLGPSPTPALVSGIEPEVFQVREFAPRRPKQQP